MVMSNEPGYYKPDYYGIRIENLIYVKQSTKEHFLSFEDLTLVPYCKNLINQDMLTPPQKKQLSDYYNKIKKLVQVEFLIP